METGGVLKDMWKTKDGSARWTPGQLWTVFGSNTKEFMGERDIAILSSDQTVIWEIFTLWK